ncbi:hypothetical protein N9N28_05000 [Rubripirellula amarantea]|nr:hypothetical protein [Rubripirellula amarantea]
MTTTIEDLRKELNAIKEKAGQGIKMVTLGLKNVFSYSDEDGTAICDECLYSARQYAFGQAYGVSGTSMNDTWKEMRTIFVPREEHANLGTIVRFGGAETCEVFETLRRYGWNPETLFAVKPPDDSLLQYSEYFHLEPANAAAACDSNVENDEDYGPEHYIPDEIHVNVKAPTVDHKFVRRWFRNNEVSTDIHAGQIHSFTTVAVPLHQYDRESSKGDPPMLLTSQAVFYDVVAASLSWISNLTTPNEAIASQDFWTNVAGKSTSEIDKKLKILDELLSVPSSEIDIDRIEKLTPPYVDDERVWICRDTAIEKSGVPATSLTESRSRGKTEFKWVFKDRKGGVDKGKRIYCPFPETTQRYFYLARTVKEKQGPSN